MTITDDQVIPELKECSFRIACDVTNPLCGERGCSAVYGPQKGATPEMVKEIYSNGFEIGIHSNTHPDMTKLNKKEIRNELATNIHLVKELTGFTPKLFRPPYGYYNNDLIEVCEELGLSCIEWSVDSLDWKGLSAGAIADRVTSRATKGSIILFHNNSDNIVGGLKMVLEFFKCEKTKVVPIGELIYYDNFVINHQGTQIKNK